MDLHRAANVVVQDKSGGLDPITGIRGASRGEIPNNDYYQNDTIIICLVD